MLKLYNSFTNKIEEFKPLSKNNVLVYNCGPTVYDYAHIGNLRSYVAEDILRRYLEYSDYKVKQIMNITDVGHMTSDADTGEDKMEKAAKREKKTPEEIARFYEKAFFEDIEKINIKRADKHPRATAHIKEMINLVKELIKKGYAYQVNGNVYYEVAKFRNYGELSGNTLKQLKAGARLEINPEKKNPFDFALWISDRKHIMGWKSPWSNHGYPGWHLECSAMSMKYLGKTIDIHAGGEDNKFPHHESEIAQSEAATGRKFVRFWLHIKHLLVNGKKMSKSKGNFYTLRDLENLSYEPLSLRFLFLQSHYQSQLNFTLDSLKASQTALNNLRRFIQKIRQIPNDLPEDNEIATTIDATENIFKESLDNNLDTVKALSATQNLIAKTEEIIAKKKISAENVYKALVNFDEVFGLGLKEVKTEFPDEIIKLKEEREKARLTKDWIKADKIRKSVQTAGYDIEDLPTGSVILNRKF